MVSACQRSVLCCRVCFPAANSAVMMNWRSSSSGGKARARFCTNSRTCTVPTWESSPVATADSGASILGFSTIQPGGFDAVCDGVGVALCVHPCPVRTDGEHTTIAMPPTPSPVRRSAGTAVVVTGRRWRRLVGISALVFVAAVIAASIGVTLSRPRTDDGTGAKTSTETSSLVTNANVDSVGMLNALTSNDVVARGAVLVAPATRVLTYLHGRGEALSIVTPADGIRMAYLDWQSLNWNDPTVTVRAMADAGYNVIALAFYTSIGTQDAVQAWDSLSAAAQAAAVAYAHSKGAVVLLSVGGSTGELSDSAVSFRVCAAYASGEYYDLSRAATRCRALVDQLLNSLAVLVRVCAPYARCRERVSCMV